MRLPFVYVESLAAVFGYDLDKLFSSIIAKTSYSLWAPVIEKREKKLLAWLLSTWRDYIDEVGTSDQFTLCPSFDAQYI